MSVSVENKIQFVATNFVMFAYNREICRLYSISFLHKSLLRSCKCRRSIMIRMLYNDVMFFVVYNPLSENKIRSIV